MQTVINSFLIHILCVIQFYWAVLNHFLNPLKNITSKIQIDPPFFPGLILQIRVEMKGSPLCVCWVQLILNLANKRVIYYHNESNLLLFYFL